MLRHHTRRVLTLLLLSTVLTHLLALPLTLADGEGKTATATEGNADNNNDNENNTEAGAKKEHHPTEKEVLSTMYCGLCRKKGYPFFCESTLTSHLCFSLSGEASCSGNKCRCCRLEDGPGCERCDGTNDYAANTRDEYNISEEEENLDLDLIEDLNLDEMEL